MKLRTKPDLERYVEDDFGNCIYLEDADACVMRMRSEGRIVITVAPTSTIGFSDSIELTLEQATRIVAALQGVIDDACDA